MKRSGFARKVYVPPPSAPPVPLAKAPNYVGSTSGEPAEKERPVRSIAYRRLVAAMPCWLCKRAGPSQACHADEGKGMSMKSSDLTCWPGCPACHHAVGSTGNFSRDERRELEKKAAAETQRTLIEQARNHAHTAYVLRQVGLLPALGGING